MNAWFFYVISFVVIIISRISVSHTSFLGAVISFAGVLLLLFIIDTKSMTQRAPYFNLPIFGLILLIVSVLGIAHEDLKSQYGFLSFFIHCCVSILVMVSIVCCHQREEQL